jgi:hypothetical protein
MNHKTLIAALLVMYLFVPVWLTGQLRVDADIKIRTEYRHGYLQPATDTMKAAFATGQRTRLALQYKNEDFSLKVSLQDVRIWGQDNLYNATSTNGDTESLQTAEAWIGYQPNKYLLVKLGRQPWVYDRERILASREWTHYGLFYDAALLSYKKEKWQADLGLSYNNKTENVAGNPYFEDKNRFQSLNFLYLKNQFSDKLTASALGLATGYNPVGISNNLNFTYTTGGTVQYQFNPVTIYAEGYYQFGKNNAGRDVDAYFFTANVQYQLNDGNVIPGVGFDYFSGHDATNTNANYQNTDHTFDMMYGARFVYYGHMNQFVFSGKQYESGGLRDLYATLDLKIKKRHMLKTLVHAYAFTANYAAPSSTAGQFKGMDKNLGWEIDLMYNYRINSFAKLSVGACYLGASNTLNQIKGIEPQHAGQSYFAWTSLHLTPQLFQKEKQ